MWVTQSACKMFPLNTNTRWLQSWEETNGSRRNRGFKDKPSKRSHRSVQKPSFTFPICQPLQEAEKYHYFCCQLTKMSFFHNSHCAISNYHECLYWTKHSTQVQACGEQQTQKPEFKTFPWGNFSEGLRDQRPSARLFDPVHFTQTVMSVLLLRDAASQCTRHRLRL